MEAFSDGPETGAEFSVHLPRALEDTPAVGAASRPTNKSRTESRVLVVDDNQDSNRTLSMLLELEGHEVASAFDGFLRFALRHREIIKRFGRFPHRNRILGRRSSEEERTFLQEKGSSF